MGTPSAVDRFLHAIETATIPACEAWADGATLDATVPNWRLHASGADAIRAEYARWFADPGRFEDVRRSPLASGDGEVIEYTLSWQENGVPHAAHHMHRLTVRDGLIATMLLIGRRNRSGRCHQPSPSSTGWARARPLESEARAFASAVGRGSWLRTSKAPTS